MLFLQPLQSRKARGGRRDRCRASHSAVSVIGFIPRGRPSARAKKPSSGGASDQVLLLARALCVWLILLLSAAWCPTVRTQHSSPSLLPVMETQAAFWASLGICQRLMLGPCELLSSCHLISVLSREKEEREREREGITKVSFREHLP